MYSIERRRTPREGKIIPFHVPCSTELFPVFRNFTTKNNATIDGNSFPGHNSVILFPSSSTEHFKRTPGFSGGPEAKDHSLPSFCRAPLSPYSRGPYYTRPARVLTFSPRIPPQRVSHLSLSARIFICLDPGFAGLSVCPHLYSIREMRAYIEGGSKWENCFPAIPGISHSIDDYSSPQMNTTIESE